MYVYIYIYVYIYVFRFLSTPFNVSLCEYMRRLCFSCYVLRVKYTFIFDVYILCFRQHFVHVYFLRLMCYGYALL